MAVSERFSEFLRLNKLRQTSERKEILAAVMSFDGHFNVGQLHNRLIDERRFMVSQATVYNTLNLLAEAGIVIRHRIADGSEYEKCVTEGIHVHLVCTGCMKVTELRDRKLERDLGSMQIRRFHQSAYALYVYGLCSKCNTALKRKQKKLIEKNNIVK